jgi:hypothetical protein
MPIARTGHAAEQEINMQNIPAALNTYVVAAISFAEDDITFVKRRVVGWSPTPEGATPIMIFSRWLENEGPHLRQGVLTADGTVETATAVYPSYAHWAVAAETSIKQEHKLRTAIEQQEHHDEPRQWCDFTREEIVNLRQPNGKPLSTKLRNRLLAVGAIPTLREVQKARRLVEQNQLAAERREAWENSKTFQLWHKADRAAHPGAPS